MNDELERSACQSGGILGDLGAEDQAQLLRTLVDSATDAIIAHEADGTIVFFSAGACELLGLSSEEMEHLGPFGWIAPGAMRGAAGRLEAILHEGRLTFESSVVRKDGTSVPTEVASRRVDSPSGPLIVAVIRDVSERRRAQQQLVHLAYHDGLTGLGNRAAFDDRLASAIADAKRHSDMLGLAYIDLDQFKPVNDRYGHAAGDEVLIEVGRRLVANVREQDTVARLGGDEFVVLLQRMGSINEFDEIGQRLLDAVRKPIAACGVNCHIDASIGFAVFDPERDDARAVLVKADVAMYAAKKDPANRWLLWSDAMDALDPPR